MCCSFSFPIGDEFFWSGKNYSSWKGPSREPPFLHTISQHCIHTCDRRERDENPIYFSLAEAIYFHSFNFFLLCFFLPLLSSQFSFYIHILMRYWEGIFQLKRKLFAIGWKMNEGCEITSEIYIQSNCKCPEIYLQLSFFWPLTSFDLDWYI